MGRRWLPHLRLRRASAGACHRACTWRCARTRDGATRDRTWRGGCWAVAHRRRDGWRRHDPRPDVVELVVGEHLLAPQLFSEDHSNARHSSREDVVRAVERHLHAAGDDSVVEEQLDAGGRQRAEDLALLGSHPDLNDFVTHRPVETYPQTDVAATARVWCTIGRCRESVGFSSCSGSGGGSRAAPRSSARRPPTPWARGDCRWGSSLA